MYSIWFEMLSELLYMKYDVSKYIDYFPACF